MLYSTERSILQKIEDPKLEERNIRLFMKRDDLIDKEVSGNKWRKLKYNIEQVKVLKKEGVLTFGGAFSNHLVATAAACSKAGLRSVGIVRGEELTSRSNDTLQKCAELGMNLQFVSRELYRLRGDSIYHNELSFEYPNLYIVPEGGANFYGMIGCQEIVKEIDIAYDSIFIAQGTTTTSCGVLASMHADSTLHVVPVLKGFESRKEMKELLDFSFFDESLSEELLQNLTVHSDAHFGGYALYSKELLDFIHRFYQTHQIALDHVYTGKAMYALFTAVDSGVLDNQTIVFIHTGGVQGTIGLEQKLGISLFGKQN